MLWMTLKHSSRRLLCFFCFLLAAAALAVAVLGAGEKQEAPRVVIGVVNLDENEAAQAALKLMGNTKELSGLFELRFLTPEQAARGGYSAVLTIPEGFTQSVLTGENKAPTVTLDAASPLEAMLARQMAAAGASYLESAQLGIYAVLGAAPASLSEAERNQLVLNVNLAFAGEFLNRYSYLKTEALGATGELSLRAHYACAVPAVALLCGAFLFAPAVLGARRFWRRAGGVSVWCAAYAHTALLCAAALFVPMLLVGPLTASGVAALCAAALLAGAFAMLVCSLFQSEVLCTAASLLLGFGAGLFSGCIVPPALLPQSALTVRAALPAWQLLRLLSVPLAGVEAPLWPALVMTAVLLALSALLWRLDGALERRGRA